MLFALECGARSNQRRIETEWRRRGYAWDGNELGDEYGHDPRTPPTTTTIQEESPGAPKPRKRLACPHFCDSPLAFTTPSQNLYFFAKRKGDRAVFSYSCL